MSRFILALVVGAVFVAGCATTQSSQSSRYRSQVGKVSPSAADRQIPQILSTRYGYSIDRRVSTGERKFYTTEWKYHTPTDEEEQKGVQESRTKITIQGKPVDRSTGGGARRFRIYLEADYQVKRDTSEWAAENIPASREDYLEKIRTFMENELASGVQDF